MPEAIWVLVGRHVVNSTTLTVLRSCTGKPLTKRLEAGADGSIVKVQADIPRYFIASRVAVEGFEGLARVLTWLAGESDRFVIRGEPAPGTDLRYPVRRLKYADSKSPATFRSVPTGVRWVCLDFDHVPFPKGDVIDPVNAPATALLFLSFLLPEEFHDVSFWSQFSSGAGLDGWQTLSAHLWFLLDQPVTDDELQGWALEHPNAPVDRCLFRPIQPHFTASPIIGAGVADPCHVRHGVVRGPRGDAVSLDLNQSRIAA